MAAELPTPYDETTGMPLPILLPEDFRPDLEPESANWHHHFHPKTAPQLDSLGGRALRNARVQLVPAKLHNMSAESYHSMFKGPPLPEAYQEDWQLRLCILAAAGYVPRQAIDVRGETPGRRVDLSDAQIDRYKTRAMPDEITTERLMKFYDKNDEDMTLKQAFRTLNVFNKRKAQFTYHYLRYRYDPMRDFFRDYILSREIDIKPKIIERFLRTEDPQKRQGLGEMILWRLADQSTVDFRDQYRRLYEAGSLHPRTADRPDKLVVFKLGSFVQRVTDLIPELEGRLTAQLNA